ncbi:MAG: ComEC/Rec2 family competence protein [Parvibaculaceae bacterium]
MVSGPYDVWDTGRAAAADRQPAIARIPAQLAAGMVDQADRWFLWAPVCMAAGIGAYFALPAEPPSPVFSLALGMGLLAGWSARRGRALPASLFTAVLLAGFVLAKARTEAVRAPVLGATTGAVTVAGTVEDLAKARRGMLRLTIGVDRIDGVVREAWPERVQVTSRKSENPLRVGDFVTLKVRLAPPEGPVEPGAYDPAIGSWFKGVGASGFTFERPVVDPARAERGWSWRAGVEDVRSGIARRVSAALPALQAGVATALITGERADIPEKVNNDLRASGLYHILSISGLHMSLVGGTAFWLIRALLALSPALALRRPIKKWAAAGSLLVAFAYLLISGADVPTQRSFLMLAVMALAVMLDRPAFSMRNVALAALAILIFEPEAVLSAGFQMSFLAVIGLVAFYEHYSAWRQSRIGHAPVHGMAARALRFVLIALAMTAATTLVASLLTALPGAYHFNRISNHALLGNLLAAPAIGLLVMPFGLLAVVLMPLGLEWLPLQVMGAGIDLTLLAAGWVASLPGAVQTVPSIPASAALIMCLGVLWFCLWRGKLRLVGLPLVMAGLLLTPFTSRPDILIERSARNIAARNGDGALSPALPRKARYAVERWLLKDGDGAMASEAARRGLWSCEARLCGALVRGKRLVYAMEGAPVGDLCGTADILVADHPLRRLCPDVPVRIDRFDVWRKGAHALWIGEDGTVTLTTAADRRGERPWALKPVSRRTILEAPAAPTD